MESRHGLTELYAPKSDVVAEYRIPLIGSGYIKRLTSIASFSFMAFLAIRSKPGRLASAFQSCPNQVYKLKAYCHYRCLGRVIYR